MSLGNVVFYDFDHCREFLEAHAKHLRDTSAGLNILGLYRELFSGFSHEALESEAIVLGQFDQGLVYMFVPEPLKKEYYPSGHKVAQKKALDLLGTKEPPMALELRAAQKLEPPLHEKARYENWMQPDLLALVDEGIIEIHLYFNSHAFHEQILLPSLQQNGFQAADTYLTSARSGYVRVRHPASPGKLYKLPWLTWVREMLAGGYSMAYIMAMLGNYMIKMNNAVGQPPPTFGKS